MPYSRIIYETDDKVWRIVERRDDHSTLADLKGDAFNPVINKAFGQEELQALECNFEAVVARDGAYGYQLQRKCGECGKYEVLDNCWGFVGQFDASDFHTNHYIVEEMKRLIKREAKS